MLNERRGIGPKEDSQKCETIQAKERRKVSLAYFILTVIMLFIFPPLGVIMLVLGIVYALFVK